MKTFFVDVLGSFVPVSLLKIMLIQWYQVVPLPHDLIKLIMSYDSRPIRPRGILIHDGRLFTFDIKTLTLFVYDCQGGITDIAVPLRSETFHQNTGCLWDFFAFESVLVFYVHEIVHAKRRDVTICVNQQTIDWHDGHVHYTWAEQCAMRLNENGSPLVSRVIDQDVVGVHVTADSEGSALLVFVEGGKQGNICGWHTVTKRLRSDLRLWFEGEKQRREGAFCSSNYTLKSSNEVIVLASHHGVQQIFSIYIANIRRFKMHLHSCAEIPVTTHVNAISTHNAEIYALSESSREILVYEKSSVYENLFNRYHLVKRLYI